MINNNSKSAVLFLLVFLGSLVLTHGMNYIITSYISSDKLTSFLILHLPTIFFMRSARHYLWYVLTILHGLAHIFHPAFIGTVYNTNYTPFYDYTVHSFQCLCVYYYNKDLFPIGVFASTMMLVGAGMAHLNVQFMDTFTWVIISGFGVFGTIMHMLLYNNEVSNAMVVMNCILWALPYLGYLNRDLIPQNDNILNKIGLFRLWYFNYFIATYIFEKYVCPKKRN